MIANCNFCDLDKEHSTYPNGKPFYRCKDCHNEFRRINRNTKNKQKIKTCIIDGCDKNSDCKNLCPGHYRQKKQGKDFTPLKEYAPRSVKYGEFSDDPNAYLRQWRKKNPQSVLKDRNIRQNIKTNIVQKIDIDLLYDIFNGCCYLCGKEVDFDKFHLEHIQPVSKGGTHTYSNLAIACSECNLSKKDRTLNEFVPFIRS